MKIFMKKERHWASAGFIKWWIRAAPSLKRRHLIFIVPLSDRFVLNKNDGST
jgi:hypothetical protein